MRVLHVNTHLNVGGIGQYIVSLAGALKSRAINCLVASSGGDLEPELNNRGIKHIYLNLKTKSELTPKVLKAAFSLADIVKEEGIDLIHAHTRVSQVASFFASRRTGVPYVSTCHGFFYPRLSRRLFDTWGRKVIAISDAVKIHLEKDFGLDEKRIELVYNGVDTDRFSASYSVEEIVQAKKSLLLKDGAVIGTMGRLSPVKGQRFLIEAMKHVISKRKDAQCLIVGGGTEEKALKDMVKGLGIEESIKFTGSNHRDTPLYLSCMDVFVLPSIKEGLGLALLEAMSAGKPCVGSNIGGISDIIKYGVNGLLVPAQDAAAIGGAVLMLLDDKVLSEKMGLKGRELVEERFSLDLMADKIASLYRKIAN